jgi:CubicO group peptidase (beta-lactamase class C family)
VPSRGGEFARAMTDGQYALGWRNHQLGGHVLSAIRGAVSGYRSLILFDPKEKVGIAMLWNSESIRRRRPVPLEIVHRPLWLATGRLSEARRAGHTNDRFEDTLRQDLGRPCRRRAARTARA